jgi:hypothetical protein
MIGPQDIWVGLALGIFFFGAKKLHELSRSLGQTLSEFTRSALIRRDAPGPDVGRRSGLRALKPIIARTVPLDEIVEAHRYMESNQPIGKIVMTGDARPIDPAGY